MNIHEYQAKEILKTYGVAIQEGIVIDKKEDALAAGTKLREQTGTDWMVVKAQVHAGGRGKGGGVKLAKNDEELQQVVNDILGMTLVTPQTSKEGKFVSKVLLAQDVYYPGANEPKEYYMSVLLDRDTGQNVIIYTTEGGMDIEQVAHDTPELIHKEFIDPSLGLQGFQARKIAFNLGLTGVALKGMVKFVTSLYNAYVGTDSAMFEINPVLKTSDDKIIAVDSKVTLDDNALYRHKDFAALRDESEEDPTEVEAKKHDLNFIKLDGNVGCMVNGAGLAMATMDIIKLSGGEPANFLDVGGSANATTVEAGFRIILKD
ncbi:ADP-forming succinate--CoA ligase subunit beta, partial [Bacteroidia bacterium]|nr:ADP-forming succinate--CoA ligase subunit beta [Bacteroidia bacterium]